MMYPNNERTSKKRSAAIIGVALLLVASLIIAVAFLWSKSNQADAIQPASLAVSCTADTPMESLPKSIKQDDSGSCVTVIRELLEVHGYDTTATASDTETIFTEQLTALVKRFQGDNFLERDGIVGEQTWSALRNTPTNREEPTESEAPFESKEPSATPSPSESRNWSMAPMPSPDPSETIPPVIEPIPEPSATAPPIVEPLPMPLPPKPTTKPRQSKPLPSVPSAPNKQPDFELSIKSYDRFTGPNTTDSVVLTYDDCPSSYDSFARTIEAAKNLGISLVLAPTADCVYKELFNVSEARNMGHIVINHSIDHTNYLTLTSAEIISELRHDAFESNFGRPPYGAGGYDEPSSAKVVKAFTEANMRMWLWSVDTEDWGGIVDGKSQKPKSAAAILNHIQQNTKKGDTVLMHMQHKGFSPESIVDIVDTLKKEGLTVCKNPNKPAPQYPTAATLCR